MTSILEKIFKNSLYFIIVFLIGSYILGKILDSKYLLSFTYFDSNSGILWIIIISIILVNIPTVKSIIREVASNRVSYLTDDEVVELFEQRTYENEKFFIFINKKLKELEAGSKSVSGIGNEISSGSKK